jgi:hypothetical protein
VLTASAYPAKNTGEHAVVDADGSAEEGCHATPKQRLIVYQPEDWEKTGQLVTDPEDSGWK